jgi:hypothetical protein
VIQRLTLAKLFRIAISVLQTNISLNGSTVRAEASIAREERYLDCKGEAFCPFFSGLSGTLLELGVGLDRN